MTSPLDAFSLAPAILPLLDMIGIGVFAASGALAAARHKQTLVTFIFFALVTGVGGGTIRDLLIAAPVFWVQAPIVPLICLAVALGVWVTPRRWWSDRALDWFDAVGMVAYAVFGATKALSLGVHPLPAFIMGVLTACAGGIIRDVLAGEPSILMRPELYVTAAALAAGLLVLLLMLGLPFWVAAVTAAGAGFALRALAILRGLRLPAYRDS